jgi:hypothetical protein
MQFVNYYNVLIFVGLCCVWHLVGVRLHVHDELCSASRVHIIFCVVELQLPI